MPIFNSQILDIDRKEAKRYAGLQKSNFDDKIIDEACELARLIINPRGIWEQYDYDEISQTIKASPEFQLKGNSIKKHLTGCKKVILIAVTVGIEIENKITSLFKEGKYGLSLILDAAATAAVEQSADQMEKAIKNQVVKQGYNMKWRFSPGYGDWPIQQQPEIVKAVQAEAIGISLTESMMLEPRKSITALIGLYEEANECIMDISNKGCSSCNKTDCPSRVKT
ncbi:MAG: methionine synthase [Anaerovibrio sp.]|uniref:vitamin B12 dependent-methionine synthase activation domain-containing protein n=1 Tax=Anaerovibrio sp. TaxID=1872532 RepID=UPI0025D1BE82|nr:vitamin B12 dependent-methionine synthase activation domain-containing protein [Anaerovibrio sp.]MCR5177134.1 methionine synthase [Anaerovibrio sp.]